MPAARSRAPILSLPLSPSPLSNPFRFPSLTLLRPTDHCAQLLAWCGPVNAAAAAGAELGCLEIELPCGVDVHVYNPYFCELDADADASANANANADADGDNDNDNDNDDGGVGGRGGAAQPPRPPRPPQARHRARCQLETRVFAGGGVALTVPGRSALPLVECGAGLGVAVAVQYPQAWNGHVRNACAVRLGQPALALLYDAVPVSVVPPAAGSGADARGCAGVTERRASWSCPHSLTTFFLLFAHSFSFLPPFPLQPGAC